MTNIEYNEINACDNQVFIYGMIPSLLVSEGGAHFISGMWIKSFFPGVTYVN